LRSPAPCPTPSRADLARLTRIYTKGGDKGTTSLGTGKRVPKHDQRVEAYGTVDEANAAIGIVRLHTNGDEDAMLARIQNDLFDLGADLCAPDGEGTKDRLRIIDAQVERLEHEIDRMNEALAPLNSFVLPGGSAASAYLHLARTIARRAERDMTRLAETEAVNPAAIRYINRLSDHLFVLARWLNDKGAKDVLWKPGATR
jgi:cob(I)alamin adenosyltransferase